MQQPIRGDVSPYCRCRRQRSTLPHAPTTPEESRALPKSPPVALAHACALGLGHLKVFFSQQGTRGVARVYVDHDGTPFVGIGPGLRFFFAAEPFAVVAHLRFRIVVGVGKRGLVIGSVWIGFDGRDVILDEGDTHYVDDGGNCRPVATVSAFFPVVQELPAEAHEHDSPGEQQDQSDLEPSKWAAAHEEDGDKRRHCEARFLFERSLSKS